MAVFGSCDFTLAYFCCLFTDENDPLSLKPNPDNFVDKVCVCCVCAICCL